MEIVCSQFVHSANTTTINSIFSFIGKNISQIKPWLGQCYVTEWLTEKNGGSRTVLESNSGIANSNSVTWSRFKICRLGYSPLTVCIQCCCQLSEKQASQEVLLTVFGWEVKHTCDFLVLETRAGAGVLQKYIRNVKEYQCFLKRSQSQSMQPTEDLCQRKTTDFERRLDILEEDICVWN